MIQGFCLFKGQELETTGFEPVMTVLETAVLPLKLRLWR
jgi:hypothetical protein